MANHITIEKFEQGNDRAWRTFELDQSGTQNREAALVPS